MRRLAGGLIDDAKMVVDGDPSAARPWRTFHRATWSWTHPLAHTHDVGGQETLIAEIYSVRAYFLDRRVEPQVHAAFFQ
jgi:hypothetical protein